MAEELRKEGAHVAKHLNQMVDYTKQGETDKAMDSYRRSVSYLDNKSAAKLYKIVHIVGYKSDTVPVAKGASKALKSYAKYIEREIKDLKKEQEKAEKAEEKFAKVREKLEK